MKVLELVRLRAEDGPASRTALVVQGGGMRGVYSMGALSALEEVGLRESFATVVGSSAGAINAAYLLAGQAHQAVRVYVDELSNKNFINLRRVHKIVDIDYMVDEVLKVTTPLDVEAVRKSPSRLEIILTDAETGGPFVITNRDNVDIFEAIRATAALPALYDRRIRVGDGYYIDGGVTESLPIMRALNDGAELIITVLTRSLSFRRMEQKAHYRLLGRLLARRQSSAIKKLIGRADHRFNEAMDLLEEPASLGEKISIYSVYPSDESKLVGRTTFQADRLEACAEMGRQDMLAVLNQEV
ncbi:MAG TPA: patatin family protein [Jatrophihabitans sp.]|nr:patatin family protein [Jatrophihabitans sp.]